MARLNTNPYTPAQLSSLNEPYIIVVDMINGFIKEGALADSAIAAAAQPIRQLVERVGSERSLFVTDCHEPGCMEFDSFPEHCLAGSSESQVIDELSEFAQNILPKNSINTFTAPGFEEWLMTLPEACDIVITGCCTDLCVLQLALSLQSWIHQHNQRGKRIYLPVDAVETYEIPGIHPAAATNEFSLANMASNGIHVVSTIS